MKKVLVGGSFAPPLSDELLPRYRAMIDALAAGPLKDALLTLHGCCAKWWELPESNVASGMHATGRAMLVPLASEVRQELDAHVPWNHEIDAIHAVCDGIPVEQRDLRNMAFHLLWHVKELALGDDQGEWGREPITTDKL